jgi:hypothetical protein
MQTSPLIRYTYLSGRWRENEPQSDALLLANRIGVGHTRFAIVADSATVTTHMCHASVARFSFMTQLLHRPLRSLGAIGGQKDIRQEAVHLYLLSASPIRPLGAGAQDGRHPPAESAGRRVWLTNTRRLIGWWVDVFVAFAFSLSRRSRPRIGPPGSPPLSPELDQALPRRYCPTRGVCSAGGV